jgi:hypothetical protein
MVTKDDMPRARMTSGFGGGRNANLSSAGNSVALRPDHHVDHGRPVDDLTAFGLRHAAGDGDVHAATLAGGFIFYGAEPAEFGIYLLGSLLADVTGVEDDEIGIVDAGGLDKTLARQRVHHALGIVDVHLTAI